MEKGHSQKHHSQFHCRNQSWYRQLQFLQERDLRHFLTWGQVPSSHILRKFSLFFLSDARCITKINETLYITLNILFLYHIIFRKFCNFILFFQRKFTTTKQLYYIGSWLPIVKLLFIAIFVRCCCWNRLVMFRAQKVQDRLWNSFYWNATQSMAEMTFVVFTAKLNEPINNSPTL